MTVRSPSATLASARARRLSRKLQIPTSASSIPITAADATRSHTPYQPIGVTTAIPSLFRVALFDAADGSDRHHLIVRRQPHDDHALRLPADLRDGADRRAQHHAAGA